MQSVKRLLIPLLIGAAVLAVSVGGWVYLSGAIGEQGIGGIGGPFTLENAAGQTVTDRDLRGRYLLVYFGYTFCPDVCPTTLNEVAGAMDALGKRADRVQPVFITVDPKRDIPKVVGDYVAAFSPRILGLTGSAEQIAAVAQAYRVYYAAQSSKDGGAYTVDHSSILYLMGPDGRFITPIRADQSAAEMAAEIGRHLS